MGPPPAPQGVHRLHRPQASKRSRVWWPRSDHLAASNCAKFYRRGAGWQGRDPAPFALPERETFTYREHVSTFVRYLTDQTSLWRIWLVLLVGAALLAPVALTLPLVERRIVDDVLLQQRLALLPGTVAVYAGVWLLLTLAGALRGTLQTYLTERTTQGLRERLVNHHGTLSLAIAHRRHSGQTTALYHNDIPQVAALFNATLVTGVSSLIGVAAGAAIMFTLSWQLALATALAPLLASGPATIVTRPLRSAARRAQDKAAELSERLEENLAGVREVAAFGRESLQARLFAAALRELLRLRMRLALMSAGLQTGQNLFTLAVSATILGYGGYLVLHGETTLGTLVAMRTLFGQTYEPATRLLSLIRDAQTGLACAERVYAFLDEQPRVADDPIIEMPAEVRGCVTFEEVSFAYQAERPVLHSVSFTAQPGEMIALVGPSGAGKSTLAGLIARFYDPTDGRVLLDGEDLRDLPLAGLRSQIGMVFQDTFLFATSVRDNIAFGRDGSTDADIVAAARAANAWEFIEKLPRGLDTHVGQRGVQLSEGQKQRLSIARALLRDPRVLILDEPTSALDARSEHLLQTALDNLLRGRTTFVIAHRLATVRRADRILVLEGGRIVQVGTHAELIGSRGLYRELTELQDSMFSLRTVNESFKMGA